MTCPRADALPLQWGPRIPHQDFRHQQGHELCNCHGRTNGSGPPWEPAASVVLGQGYCHPPHMPQPHQPGLWHPQTLRNQNLGSRTQIPFQTSLTNSPQVCRFPYNSVIFDSPSLSLVLLFTITSRRDHRVLSLASLAHTGSLEVHSPPFQVLSKFRFSAQL